MSLRWVCDQNFNCHRLMYSLEHDDFIVSLHPIGCNFYLEADSKLSELLTNHMNFNQKVSIDNQKKIIDIMLTGLLS